MAKSYRVIPNDWISLERIIQEIGARVFDTDTSFSALQAADSAASSAAASAQTKADAASSAIATITANAIVSTPSTGSRAVHEIMITSAGEVKYVYSSAAAS